jgi:hypothetical protein
VLRLLKNDKRGSDVCLPLVLVPGSIKIKTGIMPRRLKGWRPASYEVVLT